MILGNIYNTKQLQHLDKRFIKAIEWLKTNINTESELKTYEIEGKEMFVMLQKNTTKNYEEAKAEFHNKYLDIQIVLAGSEKFAFSFQQPFADDFIDFDNEKDYKLIDFGIDEKEIVLNAGDFVIFYPNEVHKPCLKVGKLQNSVLKAVIKIAI